MYLLFLLILLASLWDTFLSFQRRKCCFNSWLKVRHYIGAEPRLEPRQSGSRVCASNHHTIFCNKHVFTVMLIRTKLCALHMCSDILSVFLLCNVPRILWAHSWCPLMIRVWEFRNNFQSILGTRHYIIFIIQWSLNSGA